MFLAAGHRDQPLNLGHAVMLIIAILLLVYSAKTALKGHLSLWVISLTLLTGALLLRDSLISAHSLRHRVR